ncbi:MAG: dienelactone hydrolase family protein [Candidatus Limnocylindrales bacterium]|jgi:carboxymethylenebutenolidase
MCFDLDSSPPIRPLAGAVVEHDSLTLRAADGNEFSAFHARPAERTGKAIVILPDVRGLHHYYEELAVRFAEIGVEALAIDYFGRTAGTGGRGDDFDHGPHVAQTTWAGLSADISSAAEFLRGGSTGGGALSLFTIGFCMGGRLAFLSSTLGLGLAGATGFYGFPGGPARNDTPAPMDVVAKIECPILGIFGGADQAIPIATIQQFRDALESAKIENEVVVEPDAPHSFFDRKQAEFQKQSDDAWARVVGFIEAHGAN